MSWNNVMPAWALFPVRVKTDNGWHGFNCKSEAEVYLRENNLKAVVVLMDDDEESS